jgi:hypothetical protein
MRKGKKRKDYKTSNSIDVENTIVLGHCYYGFSVIEINFCPS